MANNSGIHPVEYKVLIKAAEVEKKTAGGVLLPDEHISRLEGAVMKGEVIEISSAAFDFLDNGQQVVVGNMVLFAKFAGQIQEGKDDVKYRLVNDKDIMAILDD